MECVKTPNTNVLNSYFLSGLPGGEYEKINYFSDFDIQQQKSEILSLLKTSGIELGCAESLVETRPSDPLEKLSADFFGILQRYSQNKAFRCDGMEQLLEYISDHNVTKDTLYQNLVECCKEQEALPPPPPLTKDFSSNLVPMDDGKVLNTNALEQNFPAGENKKINYFPMSKSDDTHGETMEGSEERDSNYIKRQKVDVESQSLPGTKRQIDVEIESLPGMRREKRNAGKESLNNLFHACSDSMVARKEKDLAKAERIKAESSAGGGESIDDCMTLLDAIPDVSTTSYNNALTRFLDARWRRMFVLMPNARRKAWLETLND